MEARIINYEHKIARKNLAEIQAQWVTVRGRIRQKIGDANSKVG